MWDKTVKGFQLLFTGLKNAHCMLSQLSPS